MKMPTWKTLGALTREARAEERVAEKMPAVMSGPKPDTTLMTCRARPSVTSFTHNHSLPLTILRR